ncbi:MAG: group II intron reverse transcriptase/maturase [Xenococcaceae cyanobacterium MO_188.B29]|nr:group II intron reverse transcriptase/maturase [Xenococcaceae cyanobacterium MO_188.B29]
MDGIKSLSPEARMKLVGQLKLTGKSKPTRRVWIPKPGKDEKRPLGIPTIYDRALQGVIKNALEPEWEARFEPNSFGFRPGRACQDAIWTIKNAIQAKAKYVLDADIAKCFDCINHLALLQKLNYKGKVRQQIKAWLKSGVIDQKVFTATSEGTPQGGICSPLLANIALHGIERMLKDYAKTLKMRHPYGGTYSQKDKVKSLTFVRYADDFVVIHKDLKVIQRCRELISEWLKDIGLELKPSKTRIAHTLNPELSEDGIAGFDFLGYNIRQFSAGKYVSSKNSKKDILGFNTFITPSKNACIKHQEQIKHTIRKHKNSSQALLIKELNPIIRGWCNYYQFSDAQRVQAFSKQDYLVNEKLRAWGRYRCGNLKDARVKYYTKIGNRGWIFATREGDANPLRLLFHSDFSSSSTEYVKVKGEASPYNGNLVYWSTRMGRNPEMPTSKAIMLRKQKGKCNWCGLHFREEDILEEDHILATALGGKHKYDNLQLLHGICHDEKTATIDLVEIRKKDSLKFYEKLSREWSKVNFKWIDDIPVVLDC